MRTLCLLLILANALYFVWAQLIGVQISTLDRPPATIATSPPRIVLAREMATQPDPDDAAGNEEVRDVEPPSVEPLASSSTAESGTPSTQITSTDIMACTSLGPFADLSQASQAQSSLIDAGFQPRQRLEQGELWVGYWVSVQNLTTRQAAERALRTLSDNGITDVYLMPGSDPANVLSLGVFSDYERAQRRASEVRALRLEPRIDDRKRAGSVYWIDVDLPESGKPIDTSIFQIGPGRIMRVEMRPCPSLENA